MARRRKRSTVVGRVAIGAGIAGFVGAVFLVGLWAGMQFRDTPEREQAATGGSYQAAPSAEEQAQLDRLVARIEDEAVKRPAPAPIPAPIPAPVAKAPVPAPAATRPAWVRHAVTHKVPDGMPMIALVIDDVGVDLRRSEAVVALPAPLTLAYLTYARDVAAQAAAARARGHELMVHVPMQPKSADADPGPNVLRVRDSAAELQRKLEWALTRFDGFVGINNHMGSRFTPERAGMDAVMQALGKRGLFFLDSITSPDSKGSEAALAAGVPVLKRDVFLDNEDTPEEVRFRLEQAEKIARKTGSAIAIGHPHDATISVLRNWIPEARERGLAIVPISTLVARRYPALWQSAGAGKS